MKALFFALGAAGLALAACAGVQPQDATDRPMAYACGDGKGFTAAYAKDGRRAYVEAGGQAYTLSFSPPNHAVGGLKFVKRGVVLRAKGPLATLDGAVGGPYQNCRTG